MNYDIRGIYNEAQKLADAGYITQAKALMDVAATLPVPEEIRGGAAAAEQSAAQAIEDAEFPGE